MPSRLCSVSVQDRWHEQARHGKARHGAARRGAARRGAAHGSVVACGRAELLVTGGALGASVTRMASPPERGAAGTYTEAGPGRLPTIPLFSVPPQRAERVSQGNGW